MMRCERDHRVILRLLWRGMKGGRGGPALTPSLLHSSRGQGKVPPRGKLVYNSEETEPVDLWNENARLEGREWGSNGGGEMWEERSRKVGGSEGKEEEECWVGGKER